jgi:hypothetical protein
MSFFRDVIAGKRDYVRLQAIGSINGALDLFGA